MTSYQSSIENQENYFIKILIPSMCGGAVIGKGGEAFVKAQNSSGAKAKISKPRDYYPGTNERVCLVKGDRKAIISMLDFITKCITDNYDSKLSPFIIDRQKQTRILIPNSSAGFLIGKEGATINEIKKLSGAYIQVSPKSDNREFVERCVVVSGDCDQRQNAMRLILDKIVEDPKLCNFPNVSYEEMVPQNSFEYRYDMNLPPQTFNSGVFNSATLQYGNNRNLNHYSSLNNSYSPNSRQFTSSFQELDLMATDSVYGITRTLEVDEIFIGSIIGPKGRFIVELQEITDTKINVSKKPSEKPAVNCKRTITINGMYEGVSRAYLLINDKIQLEREKV